MDYTVRLASPQDEEKILDLLMLMHEENGLFEMDYDSVREMVRKVLNRENGIIGVIDGEDGIEAAVCLVIDRLWYAKTWCLNDVFNFVAPKYRRSTRAKSLISFAKDYSDQVGIPLMMGIVSNVRTEAKIKLLERQMRKAGAFFIYNYGGENHDNHAQ
jgi:N-acetylglutamate synthase-like GNAT family acetyltransferase